MFFLIFCEAAAGTILAPYYKVNIAAGDQNGIFMTVLQSSVGPLK
jgi:hypothetical protein